jgi:hypothetical protein
MLREPLRSGDGIAGTGNQSQLHIALLQEGDHLSDIYPLPFSDLVVQLRKGDVIWEAYETRLVQRLSGIKQLSFLSSIGADKRQLADVFEHTRLDHSVPVSKIMEAILRENPDPSKTPAEFEKLIEIAQHGGLLHDAPSVGGGEAIKKIDRDNLDEEAHLGDVLDEEILSLLARKGIPIEELDRMIRNEGVLGQVLDIADRISYVMLDADQLLKARSTQAVITAASRHDYDEVEKAQIIDVEPNLGSIYHDVGINWETGQVYFRDPVRLAEFLRLRALLSKDLYTHPVSLARDCIVGNAAMRRYHADKLDKDAILTPRKLRMMTDEQVFQALGWDEDILKAVANWYPDGYVMFKTRAEAEQRQAEIETDDKVLLSAIATSKRFNPATDFLIQNAAGEIISLREYSPEFAAQIEAMADSMEGFLLFWQYRGNVVS